MKNGFTLIELIFTIVILAITTMAIPRMVAQTAELNILAIQQELVANAKTVVVQVSKAPWDSNCKNGKICNIPAGGSVFVPANKISVADKRRIDTVNPTTKANFGTGGTGLFADIDDYDV
ncbi:MAG: type II secretion system protein, partial [Campylobacter sp.]|nr:type II secretion system protein [Campylobacter sp.]